jgi:hypothetical protein
MINKGYFLYREVDPDGTLFVRIVRDNGRELSLKVSPEDYANANAHWQGSMVYFTLVDGQPFYVSKTAARLIYGIAS